MINDSIRYGQTNCLACSVKEQEAYDTLKDLLFQNGIIDTKDKNLRIILDRIDSDDQGTQYYVFHVYDDMKDHTATIGWYGIEIGGTKLYDFMLMKEISSNISKSILGKNITIGMDYETLIKLLGKPSDQEITLPDNEYSDFSYYMNLTYDFGEVNLNSLYSNDPSNFFVVRVCVSKKGYNGIYGIQVGDSKDSAIEKIKDYSENPDSITVRSDYISIYDTNKIYVGGIFEGNSYSSFCCMVTCENNKVTSIILFYDI